MDISNLDVDAAGSSIHGAAMPALGDGPGANATVPDAPVVSVREQQRLARVRSRNLRQMVEALAKKLQACRKAYLTDRQRDVTKEALFRLETAETWCRDQNNVIEVSAPLLEKLSAENQLYLQHIAEDWGIADPIPPAARTGDDTPSSAASADPAPSDPAPSGNAAADVA
eukprot:5035472-Amphidinium_carterae.1